MKRLFFALALTLGICQQATAASVQPVFTNDTVANSLAFNDTFGHQVVLGVYNPTTGLWTAQGIAGGFTSLTVSGNGTVAGTFGVTGLATFNSVTINGTLSGSGVSAYFASPPTIGGTTPAPAFFTNLSATGTLSGAGFTSLIAATPVGIGSVTPNGGAFTTLSASSTVSGMGFANYLLSPPAIGNTTPNTGSFTTLMASGAVTGAGVTSLFASPLPIGNTTPNTANFTALSINATGMVGDGTTSNNTPFQAALTSAASGGEIRVPCGKYKVTTSFAVTVANNKHLTLSGSGSDCTTIFESGTTAGITITYGGENSSVNIHDISFVTDDSTGVNTALTLTNSATTTNGGGPNNITNVVFHGNDGYGVSNYFGTGVSLVGVNNVNVSNVLFTGASTFLGNAISIGSISATQFASPINISNSFFFQCNKSIIYGDYVQGVSLNSDNFTQCNYGVYVPAGEHATGLDQLAVINSQFNCLIAAVYELTNVPNTSVSNSLFIIPASAIGIAFSTAATQFSIQGNIFGGANTTNDIGINFGASGGSGQIANNQFISLEYSINPAAGSIMTVTGNTFSNIANYFVGNSSIVAFGNVPEAAYAIAGLPTCNAAMDGVRLVIDNGVASPTYRAAVSTTGATWSPVWCSPTASAWQYD